MSQEKQLGWKAVFEIGEALKSLKQFSSGIEKLKQVTQQASEKLKGAAQRSKIDLHAWGEAFKFLGGYAQGFFGKMIENSPALGVQFGLLSMEVDLLAMALGETLAPVIEPLTTALTKFLQWFQQAPEPVKLFIGVVVALTVVLALLIPVIIAVQVAGAPIIVIILAIIVVIAALIVLVIWMKDNWDNLTQALKDNWKWVSILLVIIGLISLPIAILIGLIIAIKIAFENWSEIVQWFKNRFSDIMEAIKTIVRGVKTFFKNVFGGMIKTAKDAWGSMVDFFVEKFLWFKDEILKIWNKIKGPLDKIGDVVGGITGAVGDVGGAIGGIVGFAGGGDIIRSGLAYVHEGEKVLNPRQTTAFRTLFGAEGRPLAAGSGGGSGRTLILQNEINVPGGIFIDEGSLETLADMVSDMIVEKVMEGSPLG